LENKEHQEIKFNYEKIEGWDIPSRCKGNMVFCKLKKDIYTEDQKELQHRGDMPAVSITNFTILKRS
jgi:hypothetical protein